MESNRRVTTVRQLELLVEFLVEHPDLALGKVRSKEARATATRLWAEVAEILNVEGPERSHKEWTKVWNDLKCRIRGKLVSINANQRGTGGGPNTAVVLSPLEEKVARILGRDVGPLQNVAQNHFANTEENVQEENILHDENVTPPIVLHNVNEDEVVVGTSPVPSTSGQAPLTPTGAGGRNRVMRGRQGQRSSIQMSSRSAPRRLAARSALEESRAMVLRIEELRAEAALENAQTQRTITIGLIDSVRLIAESIDRFSRRYGQPAADQ